MSRSPKAWPALLFLSLAVLTWLPARAQELGREPGRDLSDDAFIERLGETSDRNPVDRKRLAKMLFAGANVLLLDEPTNHLDLASRTTLEGAMRDYTGATVFVSHDRAFIDAVATRVVEVKGHKLRSFPGNYTDYCQALESLGEGSPLIDAAHAGPGGSGAAAPKPTRQTPRNGKSKGCCASFPTR